MRESPDPASRCHQRTLPPCLQARGRKTSLRSKFQPPKFWIGAQNSLLGFQICSDPLWIRFVISYSFVAERNNWKISEGNSNIFHSGFVRNSNHKFRRFLTWVTHGIGCGDVAERRHPEGCGLEFQRDQMLCLVRNWILFQTRICDRKHSCLLYTSPSPRD